MALACPRHAHRFEAFSLKLAKQVTLVRHVVLEQRVLPVPSPTIGAFCERPGFVIIDGHQHLANFWACYCMLTNVNWVSVLIPHQRIVLGQKSAVCCDTQGLSIQRVESAELIAVCAWIYNWRTVLPCFAAKRTLFTRSLSESIVNSLIRIAKG